MAYRLENLSEKLRVERARLNITQTEASRRSGVTLKTLNHLENAFCGTNFSTIVKLADFYGVSLDYLAGREEEDGNGVSDA